MDNKFLSVEEQMKPINMVIGLNDEKKLEEQIKKMKRREAKLIFIFQEFQEHLSIYGRDQLLKRLDELNEKYK